MAKKAKAKLVWNGKELIAKGEEAQKAGLMQTGPAIVNTAKSTVHVDEGDLQRSIKIQQDEPVKTDNGFKIEIGSDDPDIGYAAIQEKGPSPSNPRQNYSWDAYMYPALDLHGAELAPNISKDFNK